MTFIHSWGCNFMGKCYPQNPRTLVHVPSEQYWLHSKWLKIIMRINNKNRNRITIKNKEIEEIDSFCYLWSVINNNGESKEEINIRISISALKKMKIWKSIKYQEKKRILSCTKAIHDMCLLLLQRHTWKIYKKIGIKWQDRITKHR